MNTINRKLYVASFLVLTLVLASCYNREGELVLNPNSPGQEITGTTIFPGNDLEVIARVSDEQLNAVWVYGERVPFTALAASYLPAARDQRLHFLFDDQGRLQYAFASRNSGERLPDVLRFDYGAGNLCYLSRYTTDWVGSWQLEWQVEVRKSTGEVLPVFVRDECGDLQGVAQRLESGLVVMVVALDAVVLPLPDWVGDSFLADLEKAVLLLRGACEPAPFYADSGPSKASTPADPGKQRALLNSNTGEEPCAGEGPITFRVERNEAGQVTFSNVEGGDGPYQYAFDGGPFQDEPAFTGPYDADQTYLMSVRLANGCVASRIGVPEMELNEGIIDRVVARDKDPGDQDFTTWLTSSFGYDQEGRVAEIEGSDNWLYSFVYSNNRLSRYLEVDQGFNEIYSFDLLYNAQGLVGVIAFSQSVGGNVGFMEDLRCSYDSEGRLARLESQNSGTYYQVEYDSRSNPVRIRVFEGGQESYRYSYTYEQAANPLTLFKVFYYDLHTYLGEYFFLPMIANGQFSPDRLIAVEYEDLDPSDPYTFSTEVAYRFDNQGRLTEVIFDEDGEIDSFLINYK